MAQKATLAYLNGIEVAPGSLFLGDLSMAFNTYEESLQPVTDLLVLRLDCTETSSYPGSGSKWNDISGNGNVASITGSLAFASSSLVFDNNTNNFIYMPHSSTYSVFDGAFTIDHWITVNRFVNVAVNDIIGFWFKNTTNAEQAGGIGARMDRNTTAVNFAKGYFKLGTTNSPSFGYFTEDGAAMVAKKWYNIQITRDVSGNTKLYSNGQLIQSASAQTGNYNNTSPMYFGKYNTTTYGPNEGNLGTFLIYDKELSSSELTQNYNYYKTKFI